MITEHNFKDLIEIPQRSSGKPNPSATRVAILESKANWKENNYDKNLYIWEKDNQIQQLTRNGKISDYSWLKDNDLIVLMTDDEKKNQLFIYQGLIGDPIQLTHEKSGISSFVIFGSDHIVYKSQDEEKFKDKSRKEKFGTFTHVEEEKPASRLQLISVNMMIEFKERKNLIEEEEAKKLVKPVIDLTKQIEQPLHIWSFQADASGSVLIFSGSEKSDLIYSHLRKNFVLTIDPTREITEYVENERKRKEYVDADTNQKSNEKIPKYGELKSLNLPEGASLIDISPDGNQLLISHRERDNKYYTQGDLWSINTDVILTIDKINLDQLTKLTGAIDQSMFGGKWTNSGVLTTYFDHTRAKTCLIDPNSLEITDIHLPEGYHGAFLNSNQNGDFVIYGFHKDRIGELFLKKSNNENFKLTNEASFYTNLTKSSIETISWESKDGTVIEGVIRKPEYFDKNKKYPLVFIVHGGPSWVSFENLYSLEDRVYYPSTQFASAGIITVYPNYRGSIGRGQSFQELNVNNLGVGDLWDIESCIDHLVKEGFIDENKVGCMGWSQGGYISAMATTHASERFVATSVGAGISDWYSYWMTTDIRKFTLDYLSKSPVEDREIYIKTAPISALDKANTPTLIQIGENDKRVPVVNATELYRGLIEKNVPTHLFIFADMPHGINKPKENLAVITQNYQWFMHYLKDMDFKDHDFSFFD